MGLGNVTDSLSGSWVQIGAAGGMKASYLQVKLDSCHTGYLEYGTCAFRNGFHVVQDRGVGYSE